MYSHAEPCQAISSHIQPYPAISSQDSVIIARTFKSTPAFVHVREGGSLFTVHCSLFTVDCSLSAVPSQSPADPADPVAVESQPCTYRGRDCAVTRAQGLRIRTIRGQGVVARTFHEAGQERRGREMTLSVRVTLALLRLDRLPCKRRTAVLILI
jgi:hypothetical protein